MKKLKLAIVGLGRAGNGMHISELNSSKMMEKYDIVAVCDTDPKRCEEFKEKFNARTYLSIEDLVKDKDIDVIDIATRSCDHYKHAKTALDAGFTVLLEKPIGDDYEKTKKLFELAQKDGKERLFIRHNRRFEPKFQHVLKIIDSGMLGNVYMIKLARNNYSRRADWQTIDQYGGGQLLNWGPHIIDHSLQFCGGGYTKLDATLGQVAASGDCEDFIKVIFHGENGRTVDMEISGGTAIKCPEYIIYGSRGALIDNGETFTIKYLPLDYVMEDVVASPDTPSREAGFVTPKLPDFITEEITWDSYNLDTIWEYLYETVINGKEYPIKSEEALMVVKATEEIKKSCSINRICDKLTKSIN